MDCIECYFLYIIDIFRKESSSVVLNSTNTIQSRKFEKYLPYLMKEHEILNRNVPFLCADKSYRMTTLMEKSSICVVSNPWSIQGPSFGPNIHNAAKRSHRSLPLGRHRVWSFEPCAACVYLYIGGWKWEACLPVTYRHKPQGVLWSYRAEGEPFALQWTWPSHAAFIKWSVISAVYIRGSV